MEAELFSTTGIIVLVVLLLSLFISIILSIAEVFAYRIAEGIKDTNSLSKIAEKVFEKPKNVIFIVRTTNISLCIISAISLFYTFKVVIGRDLNFFVSILIVLFVIISFTVIIPTLFSHKNTKPIVNISAPIIMFLGIIFRPIIKFSTKYDINTETPMEQLSKALDINEDDDISEEKDILQGVVRFGHINVLDILVPRINITSVDIEDSFSEVKEIIVKNGYSRVPVYKENIDNIAGILYVKDILREIDADDNFEWQGLIREAYFVPETKKVNSLLKEFQMKKVHLAIVVDEYGGTTGIVTMEDILEEIVGDIQDEYDENQEYYKKLNESVYIFNASTTLNDFTKLMDVNSEEFKNIEGDADTLGGLILEIKGAFPNKNDIVIYKNHKFTVIEIDKRSIKKIKYEKL